MKNRHELKLLQAKKTKLEVEIISLEKDQKQIAKEIDNKKRELNAICQEIESFANKEPIISEHAMLRYIERVIGIDLGDIEKHILSEQNRKLIDFAGNCRIKSNGVELIVKNRCVVSVVNIIGSR